MVFRPSFWVILDLVFDKYISRHFRKRKSQIVVEKTSLVIRQDRPRYKYNAVGISFSRLWRSDLRWFNAKQGRTAGCSIRPWNIKRIKRTDGRADGRANGRTEGLTPTRHKSTGFGWIFFFHYRKPMRDFYTFNLSDFYLRLMRLVKFSDF